MTLILVLLLIRALINRTASCEEVKAGLIVHGNCVGKVWFKVIEKIDSLWIISSRLWTQLPLFHL